MLGWGAFVGFILTIPAANWMIQNVGTVCKADACLIPVGFGLMAPSGVLMVGIALALRDAVHSNLGPKWAIIAILVGAALSALEAPLQLALASAVAFTLAELADLAVYSPLHRRHLHLAVILSGMVGATVDSAIFLTLAFGSLDYLPGQVIGKLWATVFAVAVLAIYQSRWSRRARSTYQKDPAPTAER